MFLAFTGKKSNSQFQQLWGVLIVNPKDGVFFPATFHGGKFCYVLRSLPDAKYLMHVLNRLDAHLK